VITERFTAHLVPNAIVASYRRKIWMTFLKNYKMV
jgi:hypothetical protein